MTAVLGPSNKLCSFKIVLLGEASVGKSALVLRCTRNIFPDKIETTIGAAFTPYRLTLDPSTTIQFEIWDTAGQERFASLAPMYYRGAAAALVVFDQSSATSYDRALMWIRQLRQNASPTIIIALIANKTDLPRNEVDLNVAAAYAGQLIDGDTFRSVVDSNGFLFFETSAKTGANVNLVFVTIGRQLVLQRQTNGASLSPSARHPTPHEVFKLDGTPSEKEENRRCCG